VDPIRNEDFVRALSNFEPVSRVMRADRPRRVASLAGMLAEYRRAFAAARRYDDLTLRCGSTVARDGIARRVFAEFYRDDERDLDRSSQ